MATKTVIQHLQILEPDIKKRAIANIIKQRDAKHLVRKIDSASGAINTFMEWRTTPEGYDYWKKVHAKLKEDGK
jgi:hypothetical protein